MLDQLQKKLGRRCTDVSKSFVFAGMTDDKIMNAIATELKLNYPYNNTGMLEHKIKIHVQRRNSIEMWWSLSMLKHRDMRPPVEVKQPSIKRVIKGGHGFVHNCTELSPTLLNSPFRTICQCCINTR